MKKILAIIMAVAMMATLSTVLFAAVDPAEKLEGDLTVTTFFNEKTGAVELKDGETLTIKFHNKSNGSNNYENYVLAVTGAVGDAYVNGDQEVLVIRADRWGWGGGMSDFVAPDGNGNKLTFTDNLEEKWDEWKAAMQAGLDVVINLTKNGNTIKYDAKMGDYTMNLEATSGKDLPETLYVFLTGENVALTGLSSEKSAAAPTTDAPAQTGTPADTGKPATTAPKTGFATIALAIAAIGSGAYIVSKKH